VQNEVEDLNAQVLTLKNDNKCGLDEIERLSRMPKVRLFVSRARGLSMYRVTCLPYTHLSP